jgi:GMP synthase (glutamine-hydrolysing)
MSKAVVLQHVAEEGPGRLLPIFRDFGIPIDHRKLWMGDEVPQDLDDIRFLLVLGGPMSVADVDSPESKYPFLKKELELLGRCVARDRATMGICLGAQLLAHAAGAKVYPNAKPGAKPEDPHTPMPEYGWGPVTFPFPGGTEPIVMGLVDGAMMFHWHKDTFDLPKLPSPAGAAPPPAPQAPAGNALLSSSRACKNQAFRFRTRLFGFQYHFELAEPDIERIVSTFKADLAALGPGAEEKIKQDTKLYYSRYARLGDRIIRNFVQFLKMY